MGPRLLIGREPRTHPKPLWAWTWRNQSFQRVLAAPDFLLGTLDFSVRFEGWVLVPSELLPFTVLTCTVHVSAVDYRILGSDLITPCVGSVSDLPTCFDFHMPLGHT